MAGKRIVDLDPAIGLNNSDLFEVSQLMGINRKSGKVLLSDLSTFISSSSPIALSSGNILVGNASNVATGVTLTLNATGGSFGLSNAGVLTMPNAATGTRGLLLAADWNTFNGKQNILVSGTNIKTINSNSLLGSGNVSVGDALVSGTLAQFSSTTSLQLASVISDETGTGSLVFSISPIFVTPNIGVATATSINGLLITGSAGTLTIPTSSSLIRSGAHSLTITSTATSNATIPSGTGTLVYLSGTNTWTSANTFNTTTTFGSTNQQMVFTPTATAPTLIQTGSVSSIVRVASGTRTLEMANYAADTNYINSAGAPLRLNTVGASMSISFRTNSVLRLSLTDADMQFTEGYHMTVGTVTGTMLGTSASQKIAFYGSTPVIKQTTAVTASAFVSNTSGILNDSATFGGYTIGQVVAALKLYGLLT